MKKLLTASGSYEQLCALLHDVLAMFKGWYPSDHSNHSTMFLLQLAGCFHEVLMLAPLVVPTSTG